MDISTKPPSAEQAAPPVPSPAEMEQAIEYFKKRMESMSDEEKMKLMNSMSEEEKSILLPGGKSSLGANGIKAEEQGIEITPSPGFTLKTRDLSTNKKVFVNVCTHEGIALPAMKKKLNDAGKCEEETITSLIFHPLYSYGYYIVCYHGMSCVYHINGAYYSRNRADTA